MPIPLSGRDIDRLTPIVVMDGSDELVIERDGSAYKISFSDFDNSADLLNYVQVDGEYTVQADDRVVECISGGCTITLPSAVGMRGKVYDVKNSGVDVVMLEGDGSETIDGQLSQNLGTKDALQVVSNGTNWVIL